MLWSRAAGACPVRLTAKFNRIGKGYKEGSCLSRVALDAEDTGGRLGQRAHPA
jgi:hypothetical protein